MTKEKVPDGIHLTGCLKELYELETSLLEQNRILDCISYHLTNDKPDLKKTVDRESAKKKSISETVRSTLFLCIPCVLIILIISAVTGLFKNVSEGMLKTVDAGIVGSITSYYKITVVLCIVVCIFVCYMRIMQDKDDAEKNRIILIQNQFQDYKASLQAEYNIGYQNYIFTNKILKTLYEKYKIDPKYRGMVPISSIYQYFECGRCRTLEEAYDLYEAESEEHSIMQAPDTKKALPDRVRDSQRMLYNALTEANHTSERIISDIQRLSEQAQIITSDSELMKYYSNLFRTMNRYAASP